MSNIIPSLKRRQLGFVGFPAGIGSIPPVPPPPSNDPFWDSVVLAMHMDEVDIPWTPASTTTAMWLDASDTDTITLGTGSAVAQWDDKSGNNIHMVQAINTSRPSLGVDGITFSNPDTQVTDPAATQYMRTQPTVNLIYNLPASTFIVLSDITNVSVSGGVLSGAESDFQYATMYARQDQHVVQHRNGVTRSAAKPATLSGPEKKLVYAEWTTSRLLSNVDASETPIEDINSITDYSTSVGITYLGVNRNVDGFTPANPLRGIIHEVIVLPDIATVGDRQIVEGYLAHKWDFADQLPVSHPYKTNAPLLAQPVFIDEKGHTVIANTPGVEITASGAAFGECASFSGGSLFLADSADWNSNGLDFTIEFMISVPGSNPAVDWAILAQSALSGLGEISVRVLSDRRISIFREHVGTGATATLTSDIALAVDTMQHVAFSRVGLNTRVFIDGVERGSTSSYLAEGDMPSGLYIGRHFYSGSFLVGRDFLGKLDDLRITRGVGRYITNFTPPVAPFPNN